MADQNNKEQPKKSKLGRRAFMITGGIIGGGLVIGLGGNMYVNKRIKQFSGEGFNEDDTVMNAWLSISADNKITIAVPRAEMGQGVYTSVPMLVAEELEVDVNDVKIFHPQPESPYANTFLLVSKPRDVYGSLSIMEKLASILPVVATGGSTTIVDGYDSMRMAGATAREALVTAAANRWEVDKTQCYAEDGHVINSTNKEKLSYGALAADAASIKITTLPQLKDPKDFKIVGKPIRRLDIPEKVTGQAQFGIDARPEGLLYASIRHPEYLGGTIESIDNMDEVAGMPGVKKIVMLAEGQGVAVVADNTWRAKNGAISLEVTENANGNEGLNSDKIESMMANTIANNEMIANPESIGDVAAVLDAEGANVITGAYRVPFLSQATMEPLNCTVLVKDKKATVWVGHQAPSVVKSKVASITGADEVDINIAYLGGGFGRRAEVDFVTKAAEVAAAIQGTPVQLGYTREEDMRYGMYRPAVASNFRAVIAKDGTISAWENKMALQSVSNDSIGRIMPSQAPKPKDDPMSTEGAIHLPYAMDNRDIAFGHLDLPIQVGNWRSVGSSQNGFFTESFMDECAVAAGQDPYLYRKRKLQGHPRFEAVLDKVAEMSAWSSPLPEGKFRGIALHKSFGSIVAQVAEISLLDDRQFSIDKFYCAIDCGRVVNPDTVEAQMQSGIIYGLSAALYGQITIEGGKIVEGNFPQYEMVRMNVSPQFDVHIMDVDEYPGGVGEPATPPAAPALTNAIYAATGTRVRSLPLAKHGFSVV